MFWRVFTSPTRIHFTCFHHTARHADGVFQPCRAVVFARSLSQPQSTRWRGYPSLKGSENQRIAPVMRGEAVPSGSATGPVDLFEGQSSPCSNIKGRRLAGVATVSGQVLPSSLPPTASSKRFPEVSFDPSLTRSALTNWGRFAVRFPCIDCS